MSLDDIREQLLERWDSVPAADLCMKFLDFVEVAPADQLQFLTFTSLCRATGRDEVDDDLMAAISILVGSRMALLDAHALLVDDNDTEYELSPTQIAEARAAGGLIHPETGELIADFEEHLIPFFVPSQRLLAELR